MDSQNETQDHGDRIARKTAGGIFWNFLAYGLAKGVVLLTTSILARMLGKDDFGLVAIAVIAINYLSVVKDLGLGMALIQRQGDIDQAANTVFTLNIILGIFLSGIVIPISPLVADYFNNPMVIPVLQWLGVSFFIHSIGSVHAVLLLREMNYRRKMIPDLGGALIKSVVSIGMAYAGYGVWALVFGQLVGAVSSVILVWIILPWRPRLELDRSIASTLFKFGFSIIGGDLLNISIDNLGAIVIGRIFGAVQLGVYTLAYRLPEMLLIGNLWIMANVTFPAFSSIQNRPDELRRGFLASVRLVQLVAVPICFGMAIAADPIVRVLFGEQWLDAIPVLRVLAVYTLMYSIAYHIGDVYKAIGRPQILMWLAILTIVLIAPALLIGSRFGLVGVAWGYVIAMVIDRIVGVYVASRYIHTSMMDILHEMLPALKGGVVMIAFTLPVLIWTENAGSFLQLICVVLVGAASYLAVLWQTEKDNLMQLVKMIRKSD
jgi:O-antigen/teichoic acid export membrane protein